MISLAEKSLVIFLSNSAGRETEANLALGVRIVRDLGVMLEAASHKDSKQAALSTTFAD